MRNWASDSLCEHCLASRLPNGFCYGDFSDDAGYFNFLISHRDFLLLNAVGKQSTWTEVPGWHKDRSVEDMLHMVHQGVACISIASLITHHFEDSIPGLTLEQLHQKLATEAWPHYRAWARARKDIFTATSSVFSGKHFNRESWQTYPELQSCYKGAMVKFMIYWTADFLREQCLADSNEGSKLRSYVAYCLARFQFIQDTSGPWFTDLEAAEECKAGWAFLPLVLPSSRQESSK